MIDEMNEALEALLLRDTVGSEDRDRVEQALDEGYDSLSDADKSRIRRLLNQQAARPQGALQRYRERRGQRNAPRPRAGGRVSLNA